MPTAHSMVQPVWNRRANSHPLLLLLLERRLPRRGAEREREAGHKMASPSGPRLVKWAIELSKQKTNRPGSHDARWPTNSIICTQMCKFISNTLHAMCAGGQTEPGGGIHNCKLFRILYKLSSRVLTKYGIFEVIRMNIFSFSIISYTHWVHFILRIFGPFVLST